MANWRSIFSGIQRRIRFPGFWFGVAFLCLVFGFVLGWLALGSPSQRIDFRTINFDKPMQIMHDQMQYGFSPQSVRSSKDDGKSQVVPSERFYDFGTIKQSGSVSWSFKITNVGDAPLVISSGYTTCTCTTAAISSSIIPSGKTSLVTVTMDSLHATPGTMIRRGVILDTNDPLMPQIEFWVQAKIIR